MSQDNRGLRAFAQDTLNAPSLPIGAYLRMFQEPTTAGVRLAGPLEPTIGISDDPTLLSGDFVEVAMLTFPGTRKVVCASTCNPGDRLYPTTNGQVDTLGSNGLGSNGAQIGAAEFIAIEANATAGGAVECVPISGNSPGGLIFVATSDSAAITGASTTETAFATNQVSIPALQLRAGDVIRVRGRAVVTGKNASETLHIRGYIGGLAGVNLFDTGAVNNSASDEIYFDFEVVVRSTGATGKIIGSGLVVDGAPGTATAKEASLQSTTLDTTAAELIVLSAQWSGSSASNTVLLRELVVEIKR